MRRKELECNFRRNVEWLESLENRGLVIPSRRLFSPNLSKSAPCKCCGPTGTNCVTVKGCGNTILPGATVTITPPGGGTASPSTGTTDSNGKFCFNGTGSGTFSFVASASSLHYATHSSVNMTGSLPTLVGAVTLSPATDYSCSKDCCQETVGPPYYQQYSHLPTNLFLNDGFGSITLTKQTTNVITPCGNANGFWYGTATRTVALTSGCTGTTYPAAPVNSTTMTMHFLVACVGSNLCTGAQTAIWYVQSCCYICGNASPPGGCSGLLALNNDTSGCVSGALTNCGSSPIQCTPVSATLTGNATGFPHAAVYGNGALSWTLTQ